MRVLHVGCGRKKWQAADLLPYVGLSLADAPESIHVTHLDAETLLEPDLVCRLGTDMIPAADASFDVVIAWHVLEHIGRQGDAAEWFYAFEELYRVLIPGGLLYGESPYYTGIWAWSDPTHARAISEYSFLFFGQDNYTVNSAISPYRINCDFALASMTGIDKGWTVITDPANPANQMIRFALAAKKPLAPWWERAA